MWVCGPPVVLSSWCMGIKWQVWDHLERNPSILLVSNPTTAWPPRFHVPPHLTQLVRTAFDQLNPPDWANEGQGNYGMALIICRGKRREAEHAATAVLRWKWDSLTEREAMLPWYAIRGEKTITLNFLYGWLWVCLVCCCSNTRMCAVWIKCMLIAWESSQGCGNGCAIERAESII